TGTELHREVQRLQGGEPHGHPVPAGEPLPRLRSVPGVPEHPSTAADWNHPKRGGKLPRMRRADDQTYRPRAHDELLRRVRLSIGAREELNRPLRKVRSMAAECRLGD